MNTWRTVGRGWRVFVPAVVGNAVIQAACVAPASTPAVDLGFLVLTLVSFAACAATLALIARAADASTNGSRGWWPGWTTWVGASVMTLAIALSSLASPVIVPFVTMVALVLLPGIAARDRHPLSGFGVFRPHPVRATLLAVGSLVLVIVAWVVALLLGFFITGPVSAFATWLIFGAVGVILICGWTSLYMSPQKAGAAART